MKKILFSAFFLAAFQITMFSESIELKLLEGSFVERKKGIEKVGFATDDRFYAFRGKIPPLLAGERIQIACLLEEEKITNNPIDVSEEWIQSDGTGSDGMMMVITKFWVSSEDLMILLLDNNEEDQQVIDYPDPFLKD